MNGQTSVFTSRTRAPEADTRRNIPSVEKVLGYLGNSALPRTVVLSIVRSELDCIRAANQLSDEHSILMRVRRAVERFTAGKLQPVINGTGILIHTNFGRAPLATEALAAIQAVGAHYNNLEYDLVDGSRGSRGSALEHKLALLCHAEAATVVNNCAAALVLALRHFTVHKPEVIISRGELLQIGGGFRIPEILEASGAHLREIGTTNQTSIEDYERATHLGTGLILKVHRSNFEMNGFVASPGTEAIAGLAKAHGIPFIEDLGSGAILATESFDISHEPTPKEVLREGADLVTFSGDKLFGGPQAGIIAGKRESVAALKKEPFFRALRCDKLIFAALEATADLYLSGNASEKIPIFKMLHLPADGLRTRAEYVAQKLAGLPLTANVAVGESCVGGGSLPQSRIPSTRLELAPHDIHLSLFAARLRASSPPLLGCLSSGIFRLDFRTIFPEQDEQVWQMIKNALAAPAE
jgi:L-seryl-tRNA(Ser) seleniumtransferase